MSHWMLSELVCCWNRTLQSLCIAGHFHHRRDRINFYGHPSNYEPEFIRHVYQKLYLVPHNGDSYILAHYEVTECDCQGSKGPYNLGNSHEEFEVRLLTYHSETVNSGLWPVVCTHACTVDSG